MKSTECQKNERTSLPKQETVKLQSISKKYFRKQNKTLTLIAATKCERRAYVYTTKQHKIKEK